MIKKILLLLALLLVGGSALYAQKKHDPKMFKEVQEYKVKFLAQEMELKEDQKARFAELYNEMSEAKMANFREMRRLEKSLNQDSSDAEYKQVSDKILECRMKDAQLEKEYDAKFATFLSQKQIYKMKAAEDKFRKKMHELHNKKKKK